MKRRALNIYAIEDNPSHIMLLEGIIESTNHLKEFYISDSIIQHKLYPLIDINDWRDYLLRQNKYKKNPKPDLLILDMMLGGGDSNKESVTGWDILEFMSENNKLVDVPVIVASALCLNSTNIRHYYKNVRELLCKPTIKEGIQNTIDDLAVVNV